MNAAPVIPTMAFDDAKALTEQIRAGTVDLWKLIERARDERAWAAIGYSSFGEYVQQEFSMSRAKAYRLLDYGHLQEALSHCETKPGQLQSVELARLETPAEQAEAWQEAVTATGGKPRTIDVEAVVEKKVRAKRNGTPEPPPHAPGEISDAELNAGDKGDPVWLSAFHFRECDEAQQIKAAGLFFDDMKPKNQMLVTALYLSALSPEQLLELGKRIDFGALIEAGK